MQLNGKVVSIHLGSEYPDGKERVTLDVDYTNYAQPPTHVGLIPRNGFTIVNEGDWKLGDELKLSFTIAKVSARTKAAGSSA